MRKCHRFGSSHNELSCYGIDLGFGLHENEEAPWKRVGTGGDDEGKFGNGQWAMSNEQRAESREQRAKSREQRADCLSMTGCTGPAFLALGRERGCAFDCLCSVGAPFLARTAEGGENRGGIRAWKGAPTACIPGVGLPPPHEVCRRHTRSRQNCRPYIQPLPAVMFALSCA